MVDKIAGVVADVVGHAGMGVPFVAEVIATPEGVIAADLAAMDADGRRTAVLELVAAAADLAARVIHIDTGPDTTSTLLEVIAGELRGVRPPPGQLAPRLGLRHPTCPPGGDAGHR